MSLRDAPGRATVAVSDIDRVSDYYEQVLGLRPQPVGGMDAVRIYPGGEGSLLQVYASEHAGGSTATIASFSSQDFESVVQELRAKGVSFERYAAQAVDARGVHTFGEHKVVWFRDPDGNTLALDNGGVPSGVGQVM